MQWGVAGREPSGFDDFFDWLNGKWGDGFAALGPWITTTDSVTPDPNQLEMTLKVNDKVWQHGSTADMIFSPEEIIAFASRFMTLEPGDVIAGGTLDGTGDAAGVYLKAGDVMDGSIGELGTLVTPGRRRVGLTMAEPVAFGVVGSGFMGQTWARVIARHVPEARLVAVAGGRGAADLAAQYGVDALDVDALFGRDDIDAVVIATPVPKHRPLTEAAARAGKHVLVEKPMTNTRADADAMVAAADAAGVRLAVVSQHRFRAAPMAAKAVIEAGRIGDIRMIRVFGPNAGWDIPADHWNSDRSPGLAVHGLGRPRLRHRPLARRPRGHARLRPVRELHGHPAHRPELDGPLHARWRGAWSRSG